MNLDCLGMVFIGYGSRSHIKKPEVNESLCGVTFHNYFWLKHSSPAGEDDFYCSECLGVWGQHWERENSKK